jgi:cytoskeleton protein RodZ
MLQDAPEPVAILQGPNGPKGRRVPLSAMRSTIACVSSIRTHCFARPRVNREGNISMHACVPVFFTAMYSAMYILAWAILAARHIAEIMGHFGSELRRERERRGISLEAMCALTKLSPRQLLDLEAENYAELPGGVFRKGFVRSYLGALGLEESTWLKRFEASYRASGLASVDEIDWASFAENVRNGRAGGQTTASRGKWLGVVAMLTVLIVLGWCVWQFVVHPRLRRSALEPTQQVHSRAEAPAFPADPTNATPNL